MRYFTRQVVLAFFTLPCVGLVKVLRRCVRDMAGKCSSVVEMCVKAEKEMNQEVGKGFNHLTAGASLCLPAFSTAVGP